MIGLGSTIEQIVREVAKIKDCATEDKVNEIVTAALVPIEERVTKLENTLCSYIIQYSFTNSGTTKTGNIYIPCTPEDLSYLTTATAIQFGSAMGRYKGSVVQVGVKYGFIVSTSPFVVWLTNDTNDMTTLSASTTVNYIKVEKTEY